jgi:c-di-GMP-binding flagellar brake protein YcgR
MYRNSRNRRAMMADNNEEMLRQAVARNLGAVLSLPSAGMLRHHKSRFLAELDGGILFEAPAGESALISELIAKRQPCGVSFRTGVHKVMFASPIIRAESGWQMNAQSVLDIVVLEFPTQIKSLQRRSNYRVEVPPDCDISVRVWRINERAYLKEPPMAVQEVKAQVRDLSTGGVGVKFLGKDNKPPLISTEDRLRVLLTYQAESLIMEGRMRAPTSKTADNSLITGIHFKKLENDLEGRKNLATLTRIVGELQRNEVRRIRLGLAKSA